jgi:hypothetical protein
VFQPLSAVRQDAVETLRACHFVQGHARHFEADNGIRKGDVRKQVHSNACKPGLDRLTPRTRRCPEARVTAGAAAAARAATAGLHSLMRGRTPRAGRPPRKERLWRAIWSGMLPFGLVSIPVRLYSATEQRHPAFQQFQKDTGDRIRNVRVNEHTEDTPRVRTPRGLTPPDRDGNLARGIGCAPSRPTHLVARTVTGLPVL